MRRQSKQNERFLVLEHDTWYKGGSVNYFKQLIDMDVFYLNIGLFMGCYAFDKRTAEHQYYMMVNGFPINCGPYCVLNRLFQTYTTNHLEQNDFYNKPFTAIHPFHHCDTLDLTRDVRQPFNYPDPLREANRWYNPTTQVIKKSLNVTQHHHSYNDKQIEKPWTRHQQFHIID